MLRRILLRGVLACLLSGALALAHEGHIHTVMGTVAELAANNIVVKTTDGKTTSIQLNKDTKYRKGKSTSTLDELKVGERVVVHANEKAGKLIAKEIRFSVGAPKQQGRPKVP